MSPTLIIAQKEIRDNLRNRWVLAATILMFALALALGFMGSTPTGSVKVDPLTVTVVSLSSLSIFLVPLIAMLMAYDALIGEIERGTMALLLSYPISRWQILLGAAFLSLGYLISAKVKERGTAAGLAIGVWLFFVVIFDMALLGILVADSKHRITAKLLENVLLFNPTDIYRLLNLTGFENTAMYSGMAGISGQIGLTKTLLVAAQIGWIIVPFTLAAWLFNRRQI